MLMHNFYSSTPTFLKRATAIVNAKMCQIGTFGEAFGDAFDNSLKIDKNGACFIVSADCPMFEMPCPNRLISVTSVVEIDLAEQIR